MAKPAIPDFPEVNIITALKREWGEQTGAYSKTGDPFATTGVGSIMDLQPAMDSLRAVETLLVIEEFVPFKLPDDIVERGGYFTEEQFLDHLVAQVRQYWNKHFAIPPVKKKEMEATNG